MVLNNKFKNKIIKFGICLLIKGLYLAEILNSKRNYSIIELQQHTSKFDSFTLIIVSIDSIFMCSL